MYIYHEQLSITEGLKLLEVGSFDVLESGVQVSKPSGRLLFLGSSGALKCWKCGIEASCFIANKHKNDKVGAPVLDLFAENNGSMVMMNRDHIIPSSLGGSNVLKNMRVACEPCNSGRGAKMNKEDLEFMNANKELIVEAKTHIAKRFLNKFFESPDVVPGSKRSKKTAKLRRARLKRAAKKAETKLPHCFTMMVLSLA